MLNETETRLEGGFEKLDELAQHYAGTDKVREQVVANPERVVHYWLPSTESLNY